MNLLFKLIEKYSNVKQKLTKLVILLEILLLLFGIWNNLKRKANNKSMKGSLHISLLTVSLPGFHPAGHTSPCVSVYWNAWTRRKVSSTERPTGKSFIVICRKTPC